MPKGRKHTATRQLHTAMRQTHITSGQTHTHLTGKHTASPKCHTILFVCHIKEYEKRMLPDDCGMRLARKHITIALRNMLPGQTRMPTLHCRISTPYCHISAGRCSMLLGDCGKASRLKYMQLAQVDMRFTQNIIVTAGWLIPFVHCHITLVDRDTTTAQNDTTMLRCGMPSRPRHMVLQHRHTTNGENPIKSANPS